MELMIKKRSGTEIEKKQAAQLLPIIENHHLLLVTLLLWNATAMETLPLFLGKLVPEFVAILLSVTLVLFVGEIIPAAIMTGPNQLEIASSLSGVVYVILCVFFPIAYPLSILLDLVLGTDEHVTTYNRVELSTMVRIQHEEMAKKGEHHQQYGVNVDEINMIDGVLKFREMLVKEVMTDDVFMLSMDDKFSFDVRIVESRVSSS